MTLFQRGMFQLHSGGVSSWKVECDTLNRNDWDTLAAIIAEKYRDYGFGTVIGVPRGGLKLAASLLPYCTKSSNILVVDDVLTTGASMLEIMQVYPGSIGVVVFARGVCPPGIRAMWQLW